MKNLINITLFSILLFSCTKETTEKTIHCATVYAQPSWAKNFTVDSLYNLRDIAGVFFSRQDPSAPSWDTIYERNVPVKFMPGGIGELDNNVPFNYSLRLTLSEPEILITNLSNLSSLYPFSNLMLNQTTIKIRIEFYSKAGCQFWLDNGVPFPLTTLPHESSYMVVRR